MIAGIIGYKERNLFSDFRSAMAGRGRVIVQLNDWEMHICWREQR